MTETKVLANLPATGDIEQWDEAEKGLAAFIGMTTVVDGTTIVAPRGVRDAYLLTVERTQLDPIAKQIYLAFIGGKWLIIVSIDGFRLVAQRSKEYRGQTAPEWSDGNLIERPQLFDGKPFLVEGKPLMERVDAQWFGVWTNSVHPAAARVGVYREGFAAPVYGVATWAGYGKNNGQWKNNGPHMLAKCAEAQALRKAFPMELSGLYAIEEFEDAKTMDGVEPSEDWAQLIKDATTVAEVTEVFERLRAAGEWNPKIDKVAKVRRSVLAVAEAEEEGETVVVEEQK